LFPAHILPASFERLRLAMDCRAISHYSDPAIYDFWPFWRFSLDDGAHDVAASLFAALTQSERKQTIKG
jgi:hypothetical protein